MNAASTRRSQKNATAVRLFRQNLSATQQTLADDGLDAAKVGMLVPFLSGQFCQIVLVQQNGRAATTMTAAIAVPFFDDR